MLPPPNYFDEASQRSCDEFTRDHPYFFLLTIASHTRSRKVDVPELDDLDHEEKTRTVLSDHRQEEPLSPMLAVRKVQPTFPSMITLGRTHNHDIVIPDLEVSRFHAYFRVLPDRVELGDAGSANGTFLDGKRLVTKGSIQIVIPGARVRFAHHEFYFLDAEAAWHRVRERHR